MDTMTDYLQELLDAQSALQRAMPTLHPTTLYEQFGNNPDNMAAFNLTACLKENVFALEDELHEMMAETGWKPWATARFVNIEAARGEAIDALHFLLNIFLALGMDSGMIRERYRRKHSKNLARQEAGYDGFTEKCPGCYRALDDEAVACHRSWDGTVICVVTGRAYGSRTLS